MTTIRPSTPRRDQYLAALAARDAIADECCDEYEAADASLACAQDAYRSSDEPRTWVFGGEAEGAADQFAHCPDMNEAVDGGEWGVTNDSVAVMVSATCSETGEEVSQLVRVDPAEPDCLEGCDHDWVDGQVYGRAAGITSTDHCALCGLSRTTYTCSQGAHAETEHDHDGVRYGDDDWSQTEIETHHGDEVPDAIVEAAKREWESVEVSHTYVARCFGDDGAQPGTVEVRIERATLRSPDREREIEVWRWTEEETGPSGPACWTCKAAESGAAKHADDSDETPDLDETIASIVETGLFRADASDVRRVLDACCNHSKGYLLLVTGDTIPHPIGAVWTTDGYLQCPHVRMPCGQHSAELAASVLLSLCGTPPQE